MANILIQNNITIQTKFPSSQHTFFASRPPQPITNTLHAPCDPKLSPPPSCTSITCHLSSPPTSRLAAYAYIHTSANGKVLTTGQILISNKRTRSIEKRNISPTPSDIINCVLIYFSCHLRAIDDLLQAFRRRLRDPRPAGSTYVPSGPKSAQLVLVLLAA